MFLCDNHIIENFKSFQYFNFETNFGEQKPFHKTGVHFLVEATKIEVTPFPFKTALSEANVKNGDYKMDLTKRVEFCQ